MTAFWNTPGILLTEIQFQEPMIMYEKSCKCFYCKGTLISDFLLGRSGQILDFTATGVSSYCKGASTGN